MRIVRAGVHSDLSISKQIAPVWELIFGCQICVSNFIYIWELFYSYLKNNRTYYRRLKWILLRKLNIDYENPILVACIFLKRDMLGNRKYERWYLSTNYQSYRAKYFSFPVSWILFYHLYSKMISFSLFRLNKFTA